MEWRTCKRGRCGVVCCHIHHSSVIEGTSITASIYQILRLTTNRSPSTRASQSSCRGGASARFSFEVSAPFASPEWRQKAQKLQKIFPVAAGDPPARDYCPYRKT